MGIPPTAITTHLPGLQHADELHGDLGEGRALVGAVTPALPHQLVPAGRDLVVAQHAQGERGQKSRLWETGQSRLENKAQEECLGCGAPGHPPATVQKGTRQEVL